jgi:hypothetical protein
MQFLGVSQQAETHAQPAVQGLGVIANNVQTAAPLARCRAATPPSQRRYRSLPGGQLRVLGESARTTFAVKRSIARRSPARVYAVPSLTMIRR